MLVGLVPLNTLLSCTLSTTRDLTNAININLILSSPFKFCKKTPHCWPTQHKHKGPQDSQHAVPPGADTGHCGHKPVGVYETGSQLSGRTEKHSIAIASSKDTRDPPRTEQSKPALYCIGLSQLPVSQEHFLRKSNFNAK